MLKWLWSLCALFAFWMAWQSGTPGMLGLWLVLGFVATLAAFLGFVAARVGAVAQSQSSREVALLVTAKGRVAPGAAAAPVAPTATAYAGASGTAAHSRPDDVHGTTDADAGGGDGGGD